jgi:hypothetical protein
MTVTSEKEEMSGSVVEVISLARRGNLSVGSGVTE